MYMTSHIILLSVMYYNKLTNAELDSVIPTTIKGTNSFVFFSYKLVAETS